MKIDFNKNNDGLVPAIIQDAKTNKVLMLGYMNEEARHHGQKEDRQRRAHPSESLRTRTQSRQWRRSTTPHTARPDWQR